MAAMSAQPRSSLRVLGFPVHVRPGFLFFMLLIVVIYGDEYGLWLAASIAGFTLLHELGHAVAARRAGATAEISLDFLAGYASYRSTEPISRPAQAGIALAGPVVHITVAVAVLVAMGVNPLDFDATRSPVESAVWLAGPLIGAFNLLPLLPLDGGNVVTSLLELAAPDRARRVMIYVSLAVTAGVGTWLALAVDRTPVVFVGLLLILQLQLLFDDRDRNRVSPWQQASRALRAGDPERARRTLVNALRRPLNIQIAPGDLDDETVRQLVDLLPRPYPNGDPWNEYVLASLLVRVGRPQDAAHYAAAAFAREPRPLIAATVARAAGALGDEATAVAWLRAAADAGASGGGLAEVIDHAPELAAVRQHPEVVAIRAR